MTMSTNLSDYIKEDTPVSDSFSTLYGDAETGDILKRFGLIY